MSLIGHPQFRGDIYIYIYKYIHIHTHTYVYIYTYTYTHTHTHTYIWKTFVPRRMTKSQVVWHVTVCWRVSSCLAFQRIILPSAGGSSSEGLLVLLGTEDECTTISRNASNYLPTDSASHQHLYENLTSDIF
jgi:hypothetical protein